MRLRRFGEGLVHSNPVWSIHMFRRQPSIFTTDVQFDANLVFALEELSQLAHIRPFRDEWDAGLRRSLKCTFDPSKGPSTAIPFYRIGPIEHVDGNLCRGGSFHYVRRDEWREVQNLAPTSGRS